MQQNMLRLRKTKLFRSSEAIAFHRLVAQPAQPSSRNTKASPRGWGLIGTRQRGHHPSALLTPALLPGALHTLLKQPRSPREFSQRPFPRVVPQLMGKTPPCPDFSWKIWCEATQAPCQLPFPRSWPFSSLGMH